jgi:uncharacterized protein YciI
MFIIRITYLTDDSAALAALRQAHYAYFAPHFESGLMILGGRLIPATGGVMIATGTRWSGSSPANHTSRPDLRTSRSWN